jgi:putative flippase GtrA
VIRLLREVTSYAGASAVAFALDIALLWTFVELLHWHYLLAGALSFLAGTLVVYTISITAVFKHRRVANPSVEFAAFTLIGVIGVCLNLVVLRVSVESLGYHYLIGKLAAAVLTFTTNFALRRWLLFSARALPFHRK